MGRDTLILEALLYLLEDKYERCSYGWDSHLYELRCAINKELDKSAKA